MVNEILQWVAVATLGLLLVATYLRLGNALPGATPLPGAEDFGPDEGDTLETAHQALLPSGESETSILVWVSSTCSSCHELLDELAKALDASDHHIRLGIVAEGEDAFRSELNTMLPSALVTAESSASTMGIPPATPLWMQFDNDFRLVTKEVGFRPTALPAIISGSPSH